MWQPGVSPSPSANHARAFGLNAHRLAHLQPVRRRESSVERVRVLAPVRVRRLRQPLPRKRHLRAHARVRALTRRWETHSFVRNHWEGAALRCSERFRRRRVPRTALRPSELRATSSPQSASAGTCHVGLIGPGWTGAKLRRTAGKGSARNVAAALQGIGCCSDQAGRVMRARVEHRGCTQRGDRRPALTCAAAAA